MLADPLLAPARRFRRSEPSEFNHYGVAELRVVLIPEQSRLVGQMVGVIRDYVPAPASEFAHAPAPSRPPVRRGGGGDLGVRPAGVRSTFRASHRFSSSRPPDRAFGPAPVGQIA